MPLNVQWEVWLSQCTVGTGKVSWDNPIVPTRGAQSQVSIPYHLVQVEHPGIIPLYQPEGFNPKCPSRTIVPFGTGGTSRDNPIVSTRRVLSQVSIPYHCTIWYGWDIPG